MDYYQNLQKSFWLSDWRPFKNKLEAILLFVRYPHEIAYQNFLNRLISTAESKHAKEIDFYIFNHTDVFVPDTGQIEQLFRSVHLLNSMDLQKNIHYLLPEKYVPLQPLAADNEHEKNWQMFFGALTALSARNTTVFLETDCYFSDGWLDRLVEFCDQASSFWVAGSVSVPLKELGQVALYATGNREFQIFLDQLFLNSSQKKKEDVALDFGMRELIDAGLAQNTNASVWRFVDSKILTTDLFFNASLPSDVWREPKELFSRRPFVILHKKDPFLLATAIGLRPLDTGLALSGTGVIDCYENDEYIFVDLDPAIWIEKSDDEILSLVLKTVFPETPLKAVSVKRTVLYHAAIFVRIKKERGRSPRSFLVSPQKTGLRRADENGVFFQIASVVETISDAQKVIKIWESSDVRPDRFVFYFLDLLTNLEQLSLQSKEVPIFSHIWKISKKHTVVNRTIFKAGQELDQLCTNINSAYSHCLKFYGSATWTLFVKPEDAPVSRGSSNYLSKFLSGVPEHVSVVNIPITHPYPTDKTLYSPLLKTRKHSFTACLNWAYAEPKDQITFKDFQILRNDAPKEPKLLVKIWYSGESLSFAKKLSSLMGVAKKHRATEVSVLGGTPIRQNDIKRQLEPGDLKKIQWVSGESGEKYSLFNVDMKRLPEIVMIVLDPFLEVEESFDQKIKKAFRSSFPDFSGVVAFRDPQSLNHCAVALGRGYIKSRGFVLNPSFFSGFAVASLLEEAQKDGKLVTLIDNIIMFEKPQTHQLRISDLNRLADFFHDRAVFRLRSPAYQAKEEASSLKLDELLANEDGLLVFTRLSKYEIGQILKGQKERMEAEEVPKLAHAFRSSRADIIWNRELISKIRAFSKFDFQSGTEGIKSLKMKLLILLHFGGFWDCISDQNEKILPGLFVQTQFRRGKSFEQEIVAATPANPMIGFLLGELVKNETKLSGLGTMKKIESYLLKKAKSFIASTGHLSSKEKKPTGLESFTRMKESTENEERKA